MEGKTQDRATAVNDKYLQTVGQTQGVTTYGNVTDQLVNWYLKNWDPDLEKEEEPLFDPYHPEATQQTEPTEAVEENTEDAA